jgi:hypothetical protein
MMKVRLTVGGAALGLLLGSFLSAPASVGAQGPDGRWPLQPSSGVKRVVAPFLEGWYENEDGTYTYSFGYSNLNEDVVELPLGEDNFIEPAKYNGMQPTVFQPGKHRGVFAVTVPASERDADVWWTLTNPNGEVTKIPGRTMWNAYQLDWNPRPHGTVPPAVSFDDGSGDVGRGPPGVMSQRTLAAVVGSPLTVEVNVEDISYNDPTDPRFRDGTELRVNWSILQGPVGGGVEFTRHESTMVPEPPAGRGGDAAAAAAAAAGGPQAGFRGRGPGPESVPVKDKGTARVIATFSAPGQYVLRGEVENFRRPDSSSGDQCCWTNAYVRVNVTQ